VILELKYMVAKCMEDAIKFSEENCENGRNSKWWNNGKVPFSPNSPDETYVRGRLEFNNVGAKVGADILGMED
jgi:hypothetical protein